MKRYFMCVNLSCSFLFSKRNFSGKLGLYAAHIFFTIFKKNLGFSNCICNSHSSVWQQLKWLHNKNRWLKPKRIQSCAKNARLSLSHSTYMVLLCAYCMTFYQRSVIVTTCNLQDYNDAMQFPLCKEVLQHFHKCYN